MLTETDQAVIARFVTQLKKRYQSLESREALAPVNRRRKLRRPCGVLLDIAFPNNIGNLDNVEFHTVRCRDLSSSGFSFWSGERPPVEVFVVRFRTEGDEILVEARAVHTTPAEEGSTSEFVIGCALTRRL